eukprot:795573-Pyramimonas_sp.AAC.1
MSGATTAGCVARRPGRNPLSRSLIPETVVPGPMGRRPRATSRSVFFLRVSSASTPNCPRRTSRRSAATGRPSSSL